MDAVVFTPEDQAFIESRRYDQQTVKSGHVQFLDTEIKKKYEAFYQRHMDKKYTLDLHCQDCLFKCVERLWGFIEREEAKREDMRQAIEISKKANAEAMTTVGEATDNSKSKKNGKADNRKDKN